MKLENAENPQEILFGDRTRKMALTGNRAQDTCRSEEFHQCIKTSPNSNKHFFFIDVANFAKNVILSYLF